MRFHRALLVVLAATLIAILFTALGIFVGLRTQKTSAQTPAAAAAL